MFDLDRWQEIIHTLKNNKMRTFLTAFGVFWGIFILVIMLGSGKGLENGVTNGMGDFATNSVFIWGQRTSIPYKGFKRGRRIEFTNEDTKALRQSIPEIELLAPRIQAWGGNGENNVVRGLKTGAFSILGDYPEVNKIDPLTITQGRFINQIDLQEKRKVAVIGQRVYNALFENNEDAIGQYIRINGVYFKVVGLFQSKHNGGWAQWQEQAIFMPLTTLQKTYNYGNRVGHYSITSISSISASKVEEKVKRLLSQRHHIHPDDKEAIGSNNVEEEFLRINGLFNGISLLVWIVGIGTLLAGIIGVSNIMLVVVKERTNEIGIQRAIGATPTHVISQIITESVVLTLIAGYIGLAAGVGVIELVAYQLAKAPSDGQMFTNPEVNFQIAMAALGILVFSGALAGLIPAHRAVSIKPIDALRAE